MFRESLFFLLRMTTIPFFIRNLIQKDKVTIVLSHSPSVEKFEEQVKALNSKYNIISLSEFIIAKQNSMLNQLPPKALIVTLDDGHQNNYCLLDIFNKYEIVPTIFLCSGVINTKSCFWFLSKAVNKLDLKHLKKVSDDRRLELLRIGNSDEACLINKRQALSKNEIGEMKRTVDFQSHSISHPILLNCSNEKSFTEIFQSKKDLEKDYNLKISAFSYPNGDYSNREVNFVRDSGYACALTCDIGFNDKNTDDFKLKRINIPSECDYSETLVRVSGMWGFMKKISLKNWVR